MGDDDDTAPHAATAKMPTEAWVLRSGPDEWEAYVRAASAERVYGLCVLDCSKQNILSFQQGAFALIRDDLTAVLPAKMAEAALRWGDGAGETRLTHETERRLGFR